MRQEWMGIVKHLVGVKAASDIGVFVCSKRVQLRIRGASTVMTSFVQGLEAAKSGAGHVIGCTHPLRHLADCTYNEQISGT
ncbi:hypothetical protein LSAT2_000217 [Lamellibrachia satsuma]|nr:hypothetical protein LSAT2_000217 [Lamellibrachia satsuma]